MIIAQFGQAADPVEALARCATMPSTCTDYSTVMVNLTSIPSDRRVLDFIAGAMAQGSQDGKNPFYASPMAVDVVRIHADADPDAAANQLLQATRVLLQDPSTAQASQGQDGFFAHVIDGLTARVLNASPPSADLRAQIVALFQTLAATAALPDTAQRADTALGLVGAAPASPTPSSAPTAVTPAAAPQKWSPLQIGAIALAGVVVVGGIAFLISQLARPAQAHALSAGRLRRRVEAGLRRRRGLSGGRSRERSMIR